MLFCRSSPTETGGRPRPPPMSIRLTYCGRQEQVKLAMDVSLVERKEAKRRARMTPEKIELKRENT